MGRWGYWQVKRTLTQLEMKAKAYSSEFGLGLAELQTNQKSFAYSGKVYFLFTLSLSWSSVDLCSSQSFKDPRPVKIYPDIGSVITKAGEKWQPTVPGSDTPLLLTLHWPN